MTDQVQRTFIMIKPDGVQRGLVGECIRRFENRGFKLVAMKMVHAPTSLLEEHYIDLKSKPFYPGLIKYMNSGPVIPMVFEGHQAVKIGRQILGATQPIDSTPGTIRGDFCQIAGRNMIHGSDGVDSATKEIALWFKAEELVSWTKVDEEWTVKEN